MSARVQKNRLQDAGVDISKVKAATHLSSTGGEWNGESMFGRGVRVASRKYLSRHSNHSDA